MRVSRLESGSFENRPGIAHEHVIDLILGDAGGAEGGQDVVRDVVVVPARAGAELLLLGEEIRPAIGVVGEDHLARIALCAEPGQHLDALRGGQEMLEAEAIHADGAPALHEPAEVAEVVTVAAVADDHASQVHAFLGEDGLLRLARTSRRHVCVEMGTPVAFWARALARRMFSITGVTPWVSVAHLMMAALTPVPPMPWVMSRTKRSATSSTPWPKK